jgi:hypothetical protein
MVDEHLVHAVGLLVILWLCMIWYWLRQRNQSTTCQTTPTPAQPTQKRSRGLCRKFSFEVIWGMISPSDSW